VTATPALSQVTATRALSLAAAVLAVYACWSCIRAPSASAGVTSALCGATGDANKLAGGVCDLATKPGKALSAAKNLVTGHFGSAFNDIFGGGSSSAASTALELKAIVDWVSAGSVFALSETNKVFRRTTTPQLGSTWFSSRYWQVAGVSALLTLPFLFAAAVQALLQSDLALLARAAMGSLPLAMLAIGIAAPMTMLLLAATDQICVGLSAAAGHHAGLSQTSSGLGALAQPFLKVLAGILTAVCALVLWLELVIREAAVYVIVLMLPLAFAAFVWPARRVWAIRAVELLVALILSKIVMVAVIDLGSAALSAGGGDLAAALGGVVLLILALLSPWALVRLIPLSELASGAVGSLRAEMTPTRQRSKANEGSGPQDTDAPPQSAQTPVDTHRALAVVEQMREHGPALNGARRASAVDASLAGAEVAGVAALAGSGNGAQPMPGGAPAEASGANGTTTTAPGGAAGEAPAPEGLDDLHPVWSARNFSLEPLPLGFDQDPSEWDQWLERQQAALGEEADPLPPRQEPEGGPL
jgi:hypothetical protein